MTESLSPYWKEALAELLSYLADEVPPLFVAGTLEGLMAEAPEVVARSVHGWAMSQVPPGADYSVGDLVYHAVRKIAMLGVLQLVDAKDLDRHLSRLIPDVGALCSDVDRERLNAHLPRLREELRLSLGPLTGLRAGAREGTGPSGVAPPQPPVNEQMVRSMRRVSMLLGQLKATPATVPPARQEQLVSHLLTAVAESAKDDREFDRYLSALDRIRGIDSTLQGVLRMLSRALPDWALAGDDAALPQTTKVNALERVLELKGGQGGEETWLPELLKLAIEHFNQGALGRAVTLLQVADKQVKERHIDEQQVLLMLRKAYEGLDCERLRDLAMKTEAQPLLRRFLRFFRWFRPEALIREIEVPGREERHLYLALLRVHGQSGREAIGRRVAELIAEGVSLDNFETLRNLVYTLRTTPGTPSREEIDSVFLLCSAHHPPQLLREAIEYLSTAEDPQVEATLSHLLDQVDGWMANPEQSGISAADIQRLLNTITKGLLRLGTSSARRTVAMSCLSAGGAARRDGITRLADLGLHDLSADPELVDRLVQELEKEMPPKVLRRFLRRDEDKIASLVMAISGTPTPPVIATLNEVADSYAGRPFGDAAREAVQRFHAAGPTASAHAPATSPTTPPAAQRPAFGGDLELFGLPTLLQNIEQGQMSGTLRILSRTGDTRSEIGFASGGLVTAQLGELQGETAFYQLLERPMPGTFEFWAEGIEGEMLARAGGQIQPVLALMLEGMRRHDELEAARLLAPDDVALKPTGTPPTPSAKEHDGALVKAVWEGVKAGHTPAHIGSALRVDDYRVRSLLVHWVEQGAVVPAT